VLHHSDDADTNRSLARPNRVNTLLLDRKGRHRLARLPTNHTSMIPGYRSLIAR
jgi:hypothetical protein